MKHKSTILDSTLLTKILLTISIISISFLFYKITTQKDTYLKVKIIGSGGEWWYTQAQPPSWIADSIKVGDVELTSSGKKNAEILAIQRYEDGANKIFSINANLRVAGNPKLNNLKYNQQPLQVGTTISLSLQGVKVTGTVVGIDGVNSFGEPETKYVTVQLYNRYGWFADSIKIGDTQSDVDSSLKSIKILHKKVLPSQATSLTSNSDLAYFRADPTKKDIELVLEISTLKRSGVNYYSEIQPLKIGNALYLSMSTYNLYDAYISAISDQLPEQR